MNGMTIKQIAELAGVSRDSVERTVRALFPVLMEKGKRTVLDYGQSVAAMRAVRKANMVALPQNAEVAPQNAEVAYTAHDLKMVMLGYRQALQEIGALSTQNTSSPVRKALPAPRLKRKPLTQVEGAARIEMYSRYPINMRGLARLLDVDPQIVRRHSDRLGYPLSGYQERTFTREHARSLWDSIIASRANSGRKVE